MRILKVEWGLSLGKELAVKVALVLLAAASVTMSAHATPDVMSFEDLVANPAADFVAVPDGYHGLNWQGVRVFNPALWAGGVHHDLYDQGVAHGAVVATNSPDMTVSSAAPFDFVGAFLSSAEAQPMMVQVFGTLKGDARYVQSYELNHLSGRFYDFNFVGVDRLTFVTSPLAPRFSMDNFTINTPVPEPASYQLMLIGAAGLALARSFRRGPVAAGSALPTPRGA